MVFRCTGLKVNSVAYQSKLSDKMEKNGSLKVDRYLQVEEIENLFAIGDCNNTPELKLAYVARLQAGKVFHLVVLNAFKVCCIGLCRHILVTLEKGGTFYLLF